jgi:hypothetical protein
LENAFGFGESAARGRILMGKILQIAAAALVANRTIEGMIREDKLEHRFMRIIDDRRGSPHAHSFVHGSTARSLQFGHFLDFDQTHAAIRVRLQFRVVAEMWNHDANPPSRFDDERALWDMDRGAIDGDAHRWGSGSIHRAQSSAWLTA